MYQSVAVFVKRMCGLYRLYVLYGKYWLACTYCVKIIAWQNEAFKGTVHPKVNYFPTGNNIMKENLDYHTCKYIPYYSKWNGVGFTLDNFY